MRRITELDDVYQEQTLWVVGRGPSLARLSEQAIGAGPIVAINQAIGKVEALKLDNPLYSMQKDRFFFRPARATVLLHERESLKGLAAVDLLDAYSFDAEQDFGYPWDVPSVVVCAGLALRWGCIQINYLCCDAVTDRDTGVYGEPATYPANYLVHGPMVRRWARLPVEWKRI